MIQITKPGMPPSILRNRGHTETETIKRDYEGDPDAYDSGAKTFEFKSSVYGAKSVKNALKKAQHDKCAFCESKFVHIAYGDVEHFRPKAGYKSNESDDLQRPGYYWLAYDWSNLYASCQICNQRFKKNLFPLVDETQRAKNHHADPVDEIPLLIDPGKVDPREFIRFRDEYPYPVDGNDLGRKSIEVLGLDRDSLVEIRRDHFATLRVLKLIADRDPPLPESPIAQARLDELKEADAPYSSMVMDL